MTAKLIQLNRFGVDSNTVFSQISDVDVVYIDNVHYIKDLDNNKIVSPLIPLKSNLMTNVFDRFKRLSGKDLLT